MGKIIFTKSATKFMLKAFNIKPDEFGFLIDDKGEYIKTTSGEPIHIDEFGGIIKGKDNSSIFIKKGLPDIIEHEDLLIRRNSEQS